MEGGTVEVKVVFDNHIYDYIFISESTYTELFGDFQASSALIIAKGDTDSLAKELTGIEAVSSVSQLEILNNNVSKAFHVLDYIIWTIVFFSGALAYIVIFNLTNINIAERNREIATVQVLGFYPKETESYVLKENLSLAVIASFLGLPLGKLFHYTVMSMVKIDMVNFDNLIKPTSYLLSFVISVMFAIIVNLLMRRRVDKVNMAESLKAVE